MNQEPSAKTLAIIVATYNQGDVELRGLVYALLAQTSNKFRAYIVHDGPSIDSTKEFMAGICEKYPDLFVYLETSERLNKWGHNSRQLALDLCIEPFVYFTNGDNLVFKDFVRAIEMAVTKENKDLILTPIVHNYFNYSVFTGHQFAINQTDWANVVFRTSMAKQIAVQINEFAADGHFFMEFRRKFPGFTQINLPCVLAVHQ